MVEPTPVNDGGEQHSSLDSVFSSLADSDRRRAVGLLYENAPEPVPRSELATVVAAGTHGKPHDEVTDEERQQVAGALHHVHFPMLTAAGLVEYDTDADTAVLADHPALQDPGILEVIEGDVSASAESLDALFRAIADTRRRAILDVLSHQFGPIHLETLARELAVYDVDSAESEVATEDVDRVLSSLHHVDLPQLAEAGLIDYDTDEQTVAYEGHPQLRVPWMHSVLQHEFRQSLTGESNTDGIGEIEGREGVVSFGQSLCDRVDDELFCMFTDVDLLEAGCFTRIRDASRRGVDVYLGTCDPTVREYIEENAPEVILWEPDTNWLNLPVADDRVGRLLLADREAVMIGTLLEETTDGFHEEQSIVGEGEHNTLVTMARQLLAPFLEEIDEDTEDVEARLPL